MKQGIGMDNGNAAPAAVEVDLDRATQLIGHGPVTLVTSAHQGRTNVMAAAWVMPYEFVPPRLALVLDKSTFTRELVEASGEVGIQVPTQRMVDGVYTAGQLSGRTEDKFAACGFDTFAAREIAAPMVSGCAAWLECRLIRDAVERFDLFLIEVVAAYADPAVYRDNRWIGQDDASRRTLHYVAGGQFFVTGEAVIAESAQSPRNRGITGV